MPVDEFEDDEDDIDEIDLPTEADTLDGDDPAMLVCPHCGEEVFEDSARCPHCGDYLSEEDAPQGRSWMVVAGVFLLIVISLASWLIFGQ